MVLLDGLSRNLIYDAESPGFYNQAGWSFLYGYNFEVAEKIFTKGLRLFQEETVFINGLRIVSKIKEDFESEKKATSVPDIIAERINKTANEIIPIINCQS